MTEEAIREEFAKALYTRGLGVKAGYSKHQVQNYKRDDVTIGTMLEFLWRLDKLEFKVE